MICVDQQRCRCGSFGEVITIEFVRFQRKIRSVVTLLADKPDASAAIHENVPGRCFRPRNQPFTNIGSIRVSAARKQQYASCQKCNCVCFHQYSYIAFAAASGNKVLSPFLLASHMPFSVMRPVTYFAGVTSKAKLLILVFDATVLTKHRSSPDRP